eukprot:scaffold32402_cov47-Phaeocystis_antarctica.AAC.2
MRPSSLATALLLLVQTDASCLTWSCSFSGYGASQSVTSGGITYSYCCSGKICSAASDCSGSTAVASPPPPSPPASQASAYFTVVGPCTTEGACVRSPNYPSNYGDSQSCTITPTSLAVGQLLSATAFSTESGYDKLIVNGVTYDGTTGPSGEVLGSAFTWSSDVSTQASGWEVCANSGPPVFPPSPPPPSPKLLGTLLATVATAPVALAVPGGHGITSSPKTLGRVLVYLAMLSMASGWQLPSQSAEPEMTTTGEAHESPITGGVDGARDRRRLATSCNAWCVSTPRPCFPPLRKLAAAFLSAATRQVRAMVAAVILLVICATALAVVRLPVATNPAPPAAQPAVLLATTVPQSTSLVVRVLWLAAK